MEGTLYFGYGSNLNQADFSHFCRRRGHRAELRPVGPAWLADSEPVFRYRSISRGGGVVDFRPRLGGALPGMLYAVDEPSWRALDDKEHPGYRRVPGTALTEDGRAHSVITYEVEPELRGPFEAPHHDYLGLVVEGLRAWALPDELHLAAARGQTGPARPDALFVYGTLRRGEKRHALIPSAPRDLRPARARGHLHHLGDYPALVPGDGPIQGELLRFDDVGAVLEALDEVEGFLGFQAADSIFRRGLVRVEPAAGDPLLAWCYLWNGAPPAAPVIESGDWRGR